MNHLPALQVIVPLLAAPSCVILRKPVLVRWFATLVCFAAFGIGVALSGIVLSQGTQSYAVGDWAPPWGIELRVDALSALLLLLVTAIASVVVVTGPGERSHSLSESNLGYYYAAYLLCLTGLIGMTLTGDAFNAFVFLEIASLSAYTLIGLGNSRRALLAAISYLMIGTIGGTFFLVGVGMLYQLTGSLNMADIHERLTALPANRTTVVAIGFLLVGIGLKTAIFPLHQWLPNAYTFAPSGASAFLAGTATKVGYYLFVRFSLTVLGAGLVFETYDIGKVLLPLGVLSMFIGAAAAIFQSDLKRLLAYSSVSQLGYMTLAFSFGSKSGLEAGLLHLFNHAAMKAGLFLAAAAIVARFGNASIAHMVGLGRRMPMTMAAIVVGGLALIGVPGTSGFISKWRLVSAALEQGHVWVALLVLLSSLLAVAYVWKLVEVGYLRPPVDERRIDEQPSLLIPAWLLTASTIFFGFFPDLPLRLTEAAAAGLFGGAR
jgi:multicomponent Na+:H+ antiporter subunit D